MSATTITRFLSLFETTSTITTTNLYPFRTLQFPSKPLSPPTLRFRRRCSSSSAFVITDETTTLTLTETTGDSHQQQHPWPEWVTFVDRLKSKGYIRQEAATGTGSDVSVYKDMTVLKEACLSFGRDRFDLFRIMSGARGGRGGGRNGGRGNGGRGGVNLTQDDLNNLLQAAFQLGHNSGGHVNPPPPPMCTYKMFRDCKPHEFSGTEGAVGLLRWLEKVESVFLMCNCLPEDRVKYSAGLLQDVALTWWNDITQTMGIGEAYAMPWENFVQLLKREYCPREEIQKLEHEVWNLKMSGSEIEKYTVRRNELAVLCPDLHVPEYRRIEHYISARARLKI